MEETSNNRKQMDLPRVANDRRDQRLYRSRSNRMVAGICGGLEELTGLDANLFRLAWLALVFFGGTGLIVYLLMAIVVPERPEGEEVGQNAYSKHWREASRKAALVLGVIVIGLGIVLLMHSLGWIPITFREMWKPFWRLFWPMVLIGLGLLVLLSAFWGERGWWQRARLPVPDSALQRSRTNRMIAGVCGGIAEYFHVDPSLVRIVWAIGALSTMGMGILAYVLAALILPEADPLLSEEKEWISRDVEVGRD